MPTIKTRREKKVASIKEEIKNKRKRRGIRNIFFGVFRIIFLRLKGVKKGREKREAKGTPQHRKEVVGSSSSSLVGYELFLLEKHREICLLLFSLKDLYAIL